jgi:hypothetical protein
MSRELQTAHVRVRAPYGGEKYNNQRSSSQKTPAHCIICRFGYFFYGALLAGPAAGITSFKDLASLSEAAIIGAPEVPSTLIGS